MEELGNSRFDVAFIDLRLGEDSGLDLVSRLHEADPDLPIIVITAYSSIESAVAAIKAGAVDYLPKPFTPDLIDQALLKVSRQRTLENRVRELESRLESESPEADFTSADPKMTELFALASRAAATPATMLILGESGTGKSMLARAIHRQSDRKDRAFVTVSCPSLSRELFESDLFGHARGAFTGAVRDKPGKVAEADGGTLFLDEIGDLPDAIQPKLLRLIQEREYERVGDPRVRTANVRVIAATNKDLEAEVKAGRFREDLYYRLNVIPLVMPPLRERLVDLPNLAALHLRHLSRHMGRPAITISEEAMRLLTRYPWPGNLRELRNCLERALIMAPGRSLEARHLPPALQQEHSAELKVGAPVSLAELERAHIIRILEIAGTQDEASSILGIDPTTLYRKRKRYGLSGKPASPSKD